ncbi:MAG: hypothetical protein IJT62_06450 [Oscillospiraceae bacterium]|nr:hypothetical protein [Oscillospiraceae bacterium]
MADLAYSKRAGDRREGRQIRTLSPWERMTPYFLRRREDALCTLSDSVEVSGIEKWLREKRQEGWAGLGFLHLLVAAYVRTVSMRPAVNRFISGRRMYARSEIQVVLNVKRSAAASAAESCVKVSFSPTDTVFDVYRRLSEAIDGVKADVAVGQAERIASILNRLPRPLVRLAVGFMRALDYFDLLPRGWLDASPFHGSLTLVDLGSLGIVPAAAALPDVGNVPCAISFGAKRKAKEPDGSVAVERHYVDYCITVDGRIADSYYFASAFKCLKYFLKNPVHLELPPETVEDDAN